MNRCTCICECRQLTLIAHKAWPSTNDLCTDCLKGSILQPFGHGLAEPFISPSLAIVAAPK